MTSPIFPFLEEDPLGRETLFQTRLAGAGLGNVQQQALSGLFQPTFRQFLGTIGQQLQQNQQPTTFASFLQNQFNPQRELARLSQSELGLGTGRLTGRRTRFLPF